MASYRLNNAQIRRLMTSSSGPVYTLIRNTTEQALNAANRFVPVDTGNLATSLGSEMRVEGDQVIGRVGFNAVHGIYVHEGTGQYGPKGQPYIIRPRVKKMLAFKWKQAPPGMPRLKDGRVLARRVTHPGIRPNPFLTKALDSIRL